MNSYPKLTLAVLLAMGAALLYLLHSPQPPPAPVPAVTFSNQTVGAGLLVYSPTFALVASDIDGDGRDDLFVGNHGYPPALYLNRDGVFQRDKDAVPIDRRADRHGYTFVDLDNDGDRDFVYAGGGADGIGKGSENQAYRNLLSESGALRFVQDPVSAVIGYRNMRARQFLPVPSANGAAVDLYLTSLHKRRKGSTNLYFSNNSTTDTLQLALDVDSTLNQPFESNGRDIFFDFDRDGDVDFLRLGQQRARLYENDAGQFRHLPGALDDLRRVETAVVADLDNDGYLDIYLGAISGHSHSDNVSANDREIHFVIVNQEGDDSDSIAFSAESRSIRIDLVEHLSEQGRNRTDAGDIFLGTDRVNPAGRKVKVGRGQARGRPQSFDQPGTYLWFDPDTQLWHALWKHGDKPESGAKGIIAASGLSLVRREDLETNNPREVRDCIAFNRRGKSWKTDCPEALAHTQWINDVTAADFNNDGLVDIAGTSAHDYAHENGTPFLALNHGDGRFTRHAILDNSEDDIFRADLIVHGFFNDDGLPDLFYTNGDGLMPSHRGPYQLWFNSSDSPGGYLILELEGGTSNRDAIGAQVELRDAAGALLGYRELGPAYGRSQDTHKLHFGLADHPGPFH
ncbi:MAG: hypothetical protein CME59_19905 [Halioglobus sp.]|nr:hypothetical protein [Halioglobus sp.]|tara:strand:+ start:9027 stop:10907 length:1881 start_codon:yes stop_codon:yes gene_type:complete